MEFRINLEYETCGSVYVIEHDQISLANTAT